MGDSLVLFVVTIKALATILGSRDTKEYGV